MIGIPTRADRRTAFIVAAVLLVVLALTAGSMARGASAETSKRCPKGSVAAAIGNGQGPVCLTAGLACTGRRDWSYHRYGAYCDGGRLSKPLPVVSRRVDVGGFRLAITCVGTGSPTVVLESGSGWDDGAWYRLQPRVAQTTRVCSYDRAGHDRSDARRPAGPVDAVTVVEELHRLLAGAGIAPPPYVLGGWSIGFFFSRLYTKHYPDEVVGLVDVDGTPWGLPGEPYLGGPPVLFRAGPGSPDAFYLVQAAADLAASPDLGERPLVVLTAGEWPVESLKWPEQIAGLSTSSILVRADRADHAIQLGAPDLTAEAFRQVVAAVRARVALSACTATPLPRLGGTCLDP